MAKTKPKPRKPKAISPNLKLDPKNARQHTPEGDAMIDASLDEIGPFRSIAIDGDDIVRAGNGVFTRAKARGLKVRIVDAKPDELIAVRRKDLKGLRAQRAALYDNRAGELSAWNGDVLAELPDKLKSGLWNADAFSQLLTDLGQKPESEPVDSEPQIDRAAELQKKWKTERGQLWAIGSHRLLCGDSTVWEDVERVMGGEKAQVTFTSPPYAEQRKSTYGGVSIDKYIAWWGSVQENTRRVTSPDGSLFLNIKPHCEDGQRVLYVFDLVLDMVRRKAWKFIDEFCWKRQTVPMKSDNRFKNYFEPVYHFSLGTKIKFRPENVLIGFSQNTHFSGKPARAKNTGHNWNAHSEMKSENYNGALPSNFLDIPSGATAEHTGAFHPASFPVRLPEFFIKAFSDTGDSVYEPFAGSGTTLVACQNLGRKCRAIELSPAYVAVCLERMATAFPALSISLVDESAPAKKHRRKPTPKAAQTLCRA